MTSLIMRSFVMNQLRSHRVQMLENLNTEEISSEKEFEEYFQ